jgi:hypothetical protein
LSTCPQKLIDALDAKGCAPKKSGANWAARCPAHEDNRASLSVTEGKDGRVLVKCHVGCATEAIVSKLGLAMADLFPAGAQKAREVAVYVYTDENGARLYEKVRYEPKDFRLRRSPGEWGLAGVRRVLYRLPLVLQAIREGTTVYVVEGEKDADAGAKLGLVCTTDDAGASKSGERQKWREEHTATLAGAARVVILPDKDEAGRARSQHIAAQLCGKVKELRVLELPGPGKDLSDWLGAGGTRVDLERLANAAPTPQDPPHSADQVGSEELDPDIAQALVELKARRGGVGKDGREGFLDFEAVRQMEHPKTPWLVQGILPQKAVAAIAGEPKTTKTWAGLEIGTALATGTRAFGKFIVGERAAVAAFMTEDKLDSLNNRERALLKARGSFPHSADGWLFLKARKSLNLQNDVEVARLVADCRRIPQRLGLLILDCLRDLHMAEENDSGEMALVMAQLRAVRDLLDCSVLFVHHSSKAGQDTRDRRPGQRMRGSSAIHATVDSGLYLFDLETDGKTYWQNNAAVEIKAARGAGDFGLRLDVRDDDQDQAEWAKWTVEEQDEETQAAKAAAQTERRETEKAEAALRKQAEHDAEIESLARRVSGFLTSDAQSVADLRAQLGVGLSKASEALFKAKSLGLATNVTTGDKKARGWVREGASNCAEGLRTASNQFEAQSEGGGLRTDAPAPLGAAVRTHQAPIPGTQGLRTEPAGGQT